MAEVERVSGKMQFDTEGGRVRATFEMAVEGNKAVGSFTGEIGVTNAELGNKEALGCFTGEIGITKADLGKEAGSSTKQIGVAKAKLVKEAGSSTKQIGVAKAKLGSEEAAGSSTREIGVAKAEVWSSEASGAGSCTKQIGVANKESAGIFTSEIIVGKAVVIDKEAAGGFTKDGVTKLGKEEAAGSFTSEIGVTKSKLGNKEAAGIDTVEMGITQAERLNMKAAGTDMVTEDSWIKYVFLTKPPAWFKPNSEPTVAMITKEKVPDSFIDILKNRRLLSKLPPVKETSPMYTMFPDLRDLHLSIMSRRNTCVDLHADILRQLNEDKSPEVGVDFTEGVKKIFILAQ